MSGLEKRFGTWKCQTFLFLEYASLLMGVFIMLY